MWPPEDQHHIQPSMFLVLSPQKSMNSFQPAPKRHRFPEENSLFGENISLVLR